MTRAWLWKFYRFCVAFHSNTVGMDLEWRYVVVICHTQTDHNRPNKLKRNWRPYSLRLALFRNNERPYARNILWVKHNFSDTFMCTSINRWIVASSAWSLRIGNFHAHMSMSYFFFCSYLCEADWWHLESLRETTEEKKEEMSMLFRLIYLHSHLRLVRGW